MEILNTLLSIAAIWIITVINNKYLIPALKNKNRFKLYRLRDELSLLAMKGDLDENSIEYITLVELINGSIMASGAFRVSSFIRFLLRFTEDRDLQQKIATIKSNISKTDHNEYCIIAAEYFKVTQKIFYSDTLFWRVAILPALKAIGFILSAVNLNTTKKNTLYRQKIMKKVYSSLDDNKKQFMGLCAH